MNCRSDQYKKKKKRQSPPWLLFLCFVLIASSTPVLGQAGPWFPGQTPGDSGHIPNPEPKNNATFGNSISIFEDRLVVGAFGDSEVYIFERDPVDEQWKLGMTAGAISGQLSPVNGWFGWSVSVWGDVLVVGAPEDWPAGAPFSGSAHIYERDGATEQWISTQVIPNPDLGNYEEFGKSVSIWGDVLAIGTSGDTPVPSTIESGSVTIFERDGLTGQWIEGQLISHPDPQGINIFGETVSLSGNRLAVGAPWQPAGSSGTIFNAGSVFLYERDSNSGEWILETSIANPEPQEWEEFGRSLSLDGDFLVVGIPLDDSAGGVDSGSVFLYQREAATGQWVPVEVGAPAGNLPGQLIGPNPSTREGFGSSVALDGDLLAVGAHLDEVNGMDEAGSVYIYQRTKAQGPWQLLQSAANPDPQQFDKYGYSVAITPQALVIAAAFDEAGAMVDVGSLYLYEPEGVFIRGDCNVDGSFNVADVVKSLSYLFSGGTLPSCLDSCDGNDDGNLNLADAVMMLNDLFLPGSPPLPSPESVCSIDPTTDPLNCSDYDCP